MPGGMLRVHFPHNVSKPAEPVHSPCEAHQRFSGEQREPAGRHDGDRPDQVQVDPGPAQDRKAHLLVDDESHRSHHQQHGERMHEHDCGVLAERGRAETDRGGAMRVRAGSFLDFENRATAPYGGISLDYNTNSTFGMCVASTTSPYLPAGSCKLVNAPGLNWRHIILRYAGSGTVLIDLYARALSPRLEIRTPCRQRSDGAARRGLPLASTCMQ